ncbi:MAG: hypothetical protein V1719_01340 [Patescibacteria group bacterium]
MVNPEHDFESTSSTTRKNKSGGSYKTRTLQQVQVLEEIRSAEIPFIVFGSWAGKKQGIFDENYNPSDVDIMVDSTQRSNLRDFFKQAGFTLQDQGYKDVFVRGLVCADVHFITSEDDQYVEHTDHGTFYYPLNGFIESEDGYRVMSPELAYLIILGGPQTIKQKEQQKLLYEFVDQGRLSNITKGFKYEPSTSKNV